jgi:hypothetical protein
MLHQLIDPFLHGRLVKMSLKSPIGILNPCMPFNIGIMGSFDEFLSQ